MAAGRPGAAAPTVATQELAASSAVLVLLYEHEAEPCVVLTRRASHLRHHAGEVAFPGGRREPGDADLWATALREAAEEVDLDPFGVRRIGRLDSFVTVASGARARPFVATAARRPRLRPDRAEVESVLHVKLSELMAADAWREELWAIRGRRERVMTFFELPGDTVWGATAAVLRRLLEIATAGPTGSGDCEGAGARITPDARSAPAGGFGGSGDSEDAGGNGGPPPAADADADGDG